MKYQILNRWLATLDFTEFEWENIGLVSRWKKRLFGFCSLGKEMKTRINDFLKITYHLLATNVANEGAKCLQSHIAPF
jgi:hypothetical protein